MDGKDSIATEYNFLIGLFICSNRHKLTVKSYEILDIISMHCSSGLGDAMSDWPVTLFHQISLYFLF